MRINVYGNGLNRRVEVKMKTPEDTDVKYIGIQIFVGPDFEHTPGDDDTSAVVFWYHNGFERETLRATLEAALKLVSENAT